MRVILVAGFPWWSLSDPVQTMVKYCVSQGINITMVGLELLPFLKKAYPPEQDMAPMKCLYSQDLDTLSTRLEEALAAEQDYETTILFLDENALTSGLSKTSNHDCRMLYYASELPETAAEVPSGAADLLRQHDLEILIQDQGRLDRFCSVFGFTPKKARLLPNTNLADGDYALSRPEPFPDLLPGSYVLLTGSLIQEHNVLAMIDAHLASDTKRELVINGWGDDLLPVIQERIEGKHARLSTDFLPGPAIRWLYANCYAGIVSYSNTSNNHRLAGMSSGKLFWLGRYAKPIICDDNESVSELVAANGLGIISEGVINYQTLGDRYEDYCANSRAFFERHSQQAKTVLHAIFRGDA